MPDARALVDAWGWNAMAFQILNPGFTLWFSNEGDAVVGYVPFGRWRVVGGAPIGPPPRLAAVVRAFEADAARSGARVCYFGTQERLWPILEEMGPSSRLLLGAQPVWDPRRWHLESKASLRAQLARARNKSVAVTRWSAEAGASDPRLKSCLADWLRHRGLPPMHFLVEPDTFGTLAGRSIHVAQQDDRIVGFLVASPIPLRRGWLVEQIVRSSEAPNGTTELLLDAAMRDLGDAEYVTLGMAPLSHRGGASVPDQPVWIDALLLWLRAHGRRFYNFAGLESFKAKFMPEAWEPLYAMTRASTMPFGALYAIGGAFSGGSPLTFLARAIVRAAGQEVRWGAASVRRTYEGKAV
jgi:phosphatidylglycerol lysyltransferase